ncbi:MAG: hypothetical protein KDA85_19695 [Planctomycetaceae bacterium]|nr:hypothetical protein [Planctomycetaceae bacterium]
MSAHVLLWTQGRDGRIYWTDGRMVYRTEDNGTTTKVAEGDLIERIAVL